MFLLRGSGSLTVAAEKPREIFSQFLSETNISLPCAKEKERERGGRKQEN